jgi:glutamyl endopeptidase
MEAFEGFQPSEDILAANGAKEPSTSIGALSFPQQQESLLAPSPADERRPVPDTTLYPFRAVAWLRIWVANFQPFIATGWFIGPRAVATAGHAVFVRSPNPAVGNRWVDRIDVVPGMNDGQTPPYGGATSTRFNSVDGWTKQGKREFDYGVIFLDEALGDTVGRFLFDAYQESFLKGTAANLAGYPEQPPDPSAPNNVQWVGARQITNVDQAFVYYDLHTSEGQSGAPVYINVGGVPHVAAIHGYARQDANFGVRLTSAICQNLSTWARYGLDAAR